LGTVLSLAVCLQLWGADAAHAGTVEQNVTINGQSSGGSDKETINQAPMGMSLINRGKETINEAPVGMPKIHPHPTPSELFK